MIDQCTATVPGIDGSVGLDVENWVVIADGPAGGAHDAHRNRVPKAERAADREDQVALPQFVRVSNWKHGEVLHLNFEKRQIRLAVDTEHFSINRRGTKVISGFGARRPRGRGEYFQVDRPLDDMGVRDDIAGWRSEHTGPARMARDEGYFGIRRPTASGTRRVLSG